MAAIKVQGVAPAGSGAPRAGTGASSPSHSARGSGAEGGGVKDEKRRISGR